MGTKLFVGNLSRATTQEDLSTLFAQAGTVASVELLTAGNVDSPKCFAFVNMGSQSDAKKAVGMLDGYDLKGRTIKVNIARPREALPAGGGWYPDPPPPSSRARKGSSRRRAR